MCAAIQHRGPDSSGGLIEAGVGLAMRRLSVIDVDGGHQPIFNEDNSIAVIFNGEIYNFQKLRQELSARGHQFSTHSDTETIVHAYEAFGLDFPKHLHGMFAIAIWDFRKQTLILARDRLGVKPLYYSTSNDRLCFASEVKSLLQDTSIRRTLNLESIHQMLTLGHILPPNTAFEDVFELEPASVLTYRSGQMEKHSYWDLEFSQPATFDETSTTDDLLTQIKGAVSRRLVSDVPLGAFLSGGIDSSIVVALMSQLSDVQVKTFAIGFDDSGFSELPFAKQVADHCGTDHHELIVKPNVPEIMDELISHHDAPFYDSSAVPTYYLSRFAREHVTVALSGDGGDEMFAGYNIYVANKVAQQFNWVPGFITNGVLLPLAAMIPESSQYINRGRVAREFLQAMSWEPLKRYTRWATKIKRETRQRLYAHDGLKRQLANPDEAMLAPFYAVQQNASQLNRLLYVGTKTELHADMLRKVDRMSMAHSLEVRSPFLDHTLFEFAATLHDNAKLNGRTTKYALRKLAKRLIPASVVDRPKRGFSIPLDRWLRNELKPYVQQILFDARTESRGLFETDYVRSLATEHFAGKISRGRELWTLMTIELFQRNYIDRFAGAISHPEPLPLTSRTIGSTATVSPANSPKN